MAYANALAALAGASNSPGAGGPAPGPPGMTPPPPTGIGAMPQGDPSSDPKSAISDAIMSLRSVKGHFPASQDRIDGIISELQSMATPGMVTPLSPPGAGGLGGAPPSSQDSSLPPPPVSM